MDTNFLKTLLSLGKDSNSLAVRSRPSFVLHLNGIIPKSPSIALFHPLLPSLATPRVIPPRERPALLYPSQLTLSCFFSLMFLSALQFVGNLTTPPLYLHVRRRQVVSAFVSPTKQDSSRMRIFLYLILLLHQSVLAQLSTFPDVHGLIWSLIC